jgi:4-amino-4-deoxy-L-arabinose transferase-like glycosyltransferase
LLVNFFFHKKGSISLAFLFTGILFGIATILVTEISSFFHAYNSSSAILFWSILCSLLTFVSFKQKLFDWNKYKFLYATNKKIIWLVGSISILLIVQGILYPPNNWDSMTYHMARIAHWVMNESVYPYPTHIYRQIYQPPLSEWIIAQVCILNKADYFANAIQLIFLIASLGVINQIMLLWNQSKRRRMIAICIAFTTPSVFMQATSTQNDIVVSFFLLGTIFFLINYFKRFDISNAIYTGLSIGLAILTKGTALVYVIPIIGFCMFFLWKAFLKKEINFGKFLPHFFVIATLSIAIAFPHFYRNYALSGDIFGASDDHYFNKNITLKSTGLNLLKNIANHASTPITSNLTNQIVEKTHLTLKIPINDENYSYKGIHFKLNKWNHNEDEVSNFLQIVLFAGVLLFLILNWKKIEPFIKFSALFCLLAFCLFSFLLKWQPWHMRLQVPLFIMASIPIALFLDHFSLKKIVSPILGFAFFYCLLLAVYNPNRPIIKNTKQAKLVTRFEKYFVAMPTYLSEYKKWKYRAIKSRHTQWDVHGDTWEYPIYYDCFKFKRKAFKSINVQNQTKKL